MTGTWSLLSPQSPAVRRPRYLKTNGSSLMITYSIMKSGRALLTSSYESRSVFEFLTFTLQFKPHHWPRCHSLFVYCWLCSSYNYCTYTCSGAASGIWKHSRDSLLSLLQSQQSFLSSDDGNRSTPSEFTQKAAHLLLIRPYSNYRYVGIYYKFPLKFRYFLHICAVLVYFIIFCLRQRS